MNSTWTAAVRYAECDSQGIVFNAHYLTWCDEAATAWFAETGTNYPALLARGLDTRVVSSRLDWSSSARWGDAVDLRVRPDRIGRTSFVLAFDVRVGDRSCCQVHTTYVLVDHDGSPTPVPPDLRAAWSGLSTG